MSQSRQKPPIGARRPSKPAYQAASQPTAEPEAQGAPPRPAETSQTARVPNGLRAEDATSGSVEATRGDPDPDPKAGLSDQQWLETLPLYAQLRGLPRRIFAEDALTYRRLWAARKAVVTAFREAQIAHASRAWADAPRKPSRIRGEFQGRTWSWIKLNNPENWERCPSVEKGGCGGMGMVGTSRCRLCQGNGYLVGHIHRMSTTSD